MDAVDAASSLDSSPRLPPKPIFNESSYNVGVLDQRQQKELQVLGLMAMEIRAVSCQLRHLGMTPDTAVAVKNTREVHELLSAELLRLSQEEKAAFQEDEAWQRCSTDVLDTTAESYAPTVPTEGEISDHCPDVLNATLRDTSEILSRRSHDEWLRDLRADLRLKPLEEPLTFGAETSMVARHRDRDLRRSKTSASLKPCEAKRRSWMEPLKPQKPSRRLQVPSRHLSRCASGFHLDPVTVHEKLHQSWEKSKVMRSYLQDQLRLLRQEVRELKEDELKRGCYCCCK